jgi:hypothetical protein
MNLVYEINKIKERLLCVECNKNKSSNSNGFTVPDYFHPINKVRLEVNELRDYVIPNDGFLSVDFNITQFHNTNRRGTVSIMDRNAEQEVWLSSQVYATGDSVVISSPLIPVKKGQTFNFSFSHGAYDFYADVHIWGILK